AVCAPLALGPNFPGAPEASRLFDLVDVNGDKIPDLISASFTESEPYNAPGSNRWCPKRNPPSDPYAAEQRLVFNVFRGKGDGTFANAELWSVPFGSWNNSCFDAERMWTLVADANGDGLADLVHEAAVPSPPTGESQETFLAYGTGHGFTPYTQHILP